MKFICSLPDRKFYQQIEPTDSWYKWEDKASPRVRIFAKTPNPWALPEVAIMPSFAKSKGDKSTFTSSLILKIYNPEPGIQTARLEREKVKSYFPHSKEPVLFFSAVQIKDPEIDMTSASAWLVYSMIAKLDTKILYLIRGASGSGKSTLARELAGTNSLSADNFPGLYDNLGKIILDMQSQSHLWCEAEATNLMRDNISPIAVANTFSRINHMKPYIDAAKRYGYRTTIITCEGDYGSIHNVPNEVRQRQLGTFEPLETGGGGLKALEIRLTDYVRSHQNPQVAIAELKKLIDTINPK